MNKEANERRGRGRPPRFGARMRAVHVNIPAAVVEAVEAEAERTGLSHSEIVRQALVAWLERDRGERDRLTLEI